MAKKREVQEIWLFGIISGFQKHSVFILQKQVLQTQSTEADLYVEFNAINSPYISGSSIWSCRYFHSILNKYNLFANG